EGSTTHRGMQRRLWVAGGSLLAVCGIALSAGGAYAYYFDSTRVDVIAVGVQIAGIDVGGLHASEARQVLEARLAERLREPVYVVYGKRSFTVRPTQAGLHVDVATMVDAAVQASRSGGLAHRFFRDLGGQPLGRTIPIQG